MSKGIAISTVLKFLLGLLVLVIVAFMVYRIFYAPPLSREECRMQITSWCSDCDMLDYTGGEKISQGMFDCADEYFGASFTAENTCSGYENECKPFLGKG